MARESNRAAPVERGERGREVEAQRATEVSTARVLVGFAERGLGIGDRLGLGWRRARGEVRDVRRLRCVGERLVATRARGARASAEARSRRPRARRAATRGPWRAAPSASSTEWSPAGPMTCRVTSWRSSTPRSSPHLAGRRRSLRIRRRLRRIGHRAHVARVDERHLRLWRRTCSAVAARVLQVLGALRVNRRATAPTRRTGSSDEAIAKIA